MGVDGIHVYIGDRLESTGNGVVRTTREDKGRDLTNRKGVEGRIDSFEIQKCNGRLSSASFDHHSLLSYLPY